MRWVRQLGVRDCSAILKIGNTKKEKEKTQGKTKEAPCNCNRDFLSAVHWQLMATFGVIAIVAFWGN